MNTYRMLQRQRDINRISLNIKVRTAWSNFGKSMKNCFKAMIKFKEAMENKHV